MKRVSQSVGGNLPAFCQQGFYLQVGIRFHQSAVQLMNGPNNGLVFGKGRVKTGNAGGLVVLEHLFIRMTNSIAAGNEALQGNQPTNWNSAVKNTEAVHECEGVQLI